jgi:tripartite ATP-independent transporter DctP family solute receptor
MLGSAPEKQTPQEGAKKGVLMHGGSRRELMRWVAGASILGLSGISADARTFRAADNQVEDYPTVQALLFLDRLVRERTSGRHGIQVFHSRQLGEEKETLDQTRAGAIDLDRVNSASIASIVPEANVLVLPFLFRSTEHARRVLDGPLGDEILARFEPHGFIALAFYDSGARSIYNSVRPIRSIEDLKGLRIRVQQSEMAIEMVKALGATPLPLPYGQVGTALTTRIIDGAENNWPSYASTGHYRAAPYYTVTEHTMAPEVLVMSLKAWGSLAPEDQAVFRQAARESAQFMRDLWRRWEDNSRQEAERSGVTVVTQIDRKPFEAAMTGLYERVVTDPKLKDLVDRIRATP